MGKDSELDLFGCAIGMTDLHCRDFSEAKITLNKVVNKFMVQKRDKIKVALAALRKKVEKQLDIS